MVVVMKDGYRLHLVRKVARSIASINMWSMGKVWRILIGEGLGVESVRGSWMLGGARMNIVVLVIHVA